jgi:hypothetical protein
MEKMNREPWAQLGCSAGRVGPPASGGGGIRARTRQGWANVRQSGAAGDVRGGPWCALGWGRGAVGRGAWKG